MGYGLSILIWLRRLGRRSRASVFFFLLFRLRRKGEKELKGRLCDFYEKRIDN